MAYATSAQYLLIYDSSASVERLDAYLGKASRKVDAALALHGAKVPADTSEIDGLAAALADTVIDMVHRVLGDGSDSSGEMPDGVTSYSQTLPGGFTESFGWAQPYTDMKIRDDELEYLLSLLGVDTSGVGIWRAWGGDTDEGTD
jgi:hypothetical protein